VGRTPPGDPPAFEKAWALAEGLAFGKALAGELAVEGRRSLSFIKTGENSN
jgi:hypothetical protein